MHFARRSAEGINLRAATSLATYRARRYLESPWSFILLGRQAENMNIRNLIHDDVMAKVLSTRTAGLPSLWICPNRRSPSHRCYRSRCHPSPPQPAAYRFIQRYGGFLRSQAGIRCGGPVFVVPVLGIPSGEDYGSRLRVSTGCQCDRSMALQLRPER